ncbi:MAG: GIY-YIG nuclease family protein [Ilumatobacteraceae bacterium]
MNTSQLAGLGFAVAGTCVLDAKLKSGVRMVVHANREDRSIYAFVVDGDAKYIGICDSSATCLSARMSRYQGLMGAGTNKRIATLLRAALEANQRVEILAWVPPGPVLVGQLEVDLVKGLENPLIALIKPEWNIHS